MCILITMLVVFFSIFCLSFFYIDQKPFFINHHCDFHDLPPIGSFHGQPPRLCLQTWRFRTRRGPGKPVETWGASWPQFARVFFGKAT